VQKKMKVFFLRLIGSGPSNVSVDRTAETAWVLRPEA
jgi:hypothetical protein